jgi:hypothetical protein
MEFLCLPRPGFSFPFGEPAVTPHFVFLYPQNPSVSLLGKALLQFKRCHLVPFLGEHDSRTLFGNRLL